MSFLDDVGNFFLGGGANPPKANTATLDPGTQQAVSNVNGSANESQDQIQKELMSGVAGTGQGLLPSKESLTQSENQLGMTSSDSQKQALSDRNQRIYGQELSQTQRQAPMQAAQMQMQRLQQAQGVLQARDKFNLSVANANITSLVDQNAARQQVLGEIIGLGGGIAGYAGGGGFAGAVSGSKARKGLSGYKGGSSKTSAGSDEDELNDTSWYEGE